jgi:dynamin 1-like protein
LEKYPQIKDSIRTVVEDLVNSCVEPCVKFINDVIDNEKCFINTARHDFRGAAVLAEKRQNEALPAKKSKQQLEQDNTKTLLALCARYFELVKQQIVDLVPKAIVLLLVEQSSSSLITELMRKVKLADDLTKEDPRISQLRKKCQETLVALRKADVILGTVTGFSV